MRALSLLIMIEETKLVTIIHNAPLDYLTEKTLDALESFLIGVHAYLVHNKSTCLTDNIANNAIREWFLKDLIVTEEHASRMNAFNCMSPISYCRLMSDSDEAAFNLYVNMRREAYLASPKINVPNEPYNAKPLTFFEFIERVKKRPGMYVEKWDISAYENMARGYIYAECELVGGESDLKNELQEFKCWLDERYPYGINRPFSKVIEFTCKGQRLSDIEYFEEHLDMFRGNEAADTQDRTQELMITNIIKHAKKMKKDNN